MSEENRETALPTWTPLTSLPTSNKKKKEIDFTEKRGKIKK